METKFLCPHPYKKVGWALLIPFFILGIFYTMTGQEYELDFLTYSQGKTSIFEEDSFLFNLSYNNFTNEIIGVGLLIGLILTAFSKEEIEDERIKHLRLESLLWAVYCNSFLILVAIICIYGGLFMTVMTYAMFTPLLFFITRFNWLLWRERRQSVQILI
jgi:hypothetical protein